MGLLAALNNAVSGLNVNQKNLSVLSQNVTNANTPDYSRQVANQQADYIAGNDAGASIASITRAVNDFLTKQVQSQTSINSGNSAITDYYSQLQNLLGQPGGTNSFDQAVSSFFVAVQNMANSPSSITETNVVNAASSAAGQISGLAGALQNLRLQADSDISGAAGNVNSDLLNLFKNNQAIEQANATNQNTNGLLDQRDALIADLSQYLNITTNIQPDGTMAIGTSGGITLLTSTTYAQLSHTPVSSAQTLINNGNLSPINVTTIDANGRSLGQPTILATGGPSASVTTTLVSGKIQALMQLRDSIIPNILGQMDQLAGTMRDSFNAINNAGTSFPPPNSYTGTTLLSGNSTSAYSGSVRIAVLDKNGNPVASPYADESNGLQPFTLDLGSFDNGQGAGVSSVDQIINAINQNFGAPQNKVELGSLNNVQLGMVSNTVPDAGVGGMSFAFNLNNISSKPANFFVNNVTVLDNLGNTVSTGVTTTQPLLTLSASGTGAYTFDGTNNVIVNTDGPPSFSNGDVIYLNPPTAANVNGISGSSLGGYFVVSNVSGNHFQITVPGASTATPGNGNAGGAVTGYTKYATALSGQTVNTAANGVVTASITNNGANLTPSYYTVQATVATLDASGNIVQSVVTYRVPNNTSNVAHNLIGATTASGAGTLMAPSTPSSQPILTASLVDANGNPISKINGVYGNQQGYLKIMANNTSYTVAIDELNSQQLGFSGGTGPTAATNQGFSQYFGLNNFFNPPAAPGDLANSAINLAVSSRLLSNPGLISTGKLALGNQPTNSVLAPNFTYRVSLGDNSIAQQLAALSTSQTKFNSVGGLSASSTTFAQYAGQIIAATSTNSSNATNAKNDSQALLDGFTKSAQQVSGVNLDQELANTVIYQNAYSASARVISVVSTMFNELISSVGG